MKEILINQTGCSTRKAEEFLLSKAHLLFLFDTAKGVIKMAIGVAILDMFWEFSGMAGKEQQN